MHGPPDRACDGRRPLKSKEAAGETAAPPTFDASVARLEQILAELESGDRDLEDALELFEEGVGLLREASARLAGAEQRIEQLLGEGDDLSFQAFEGGAEG